MFQSDHPRFENMADAFTHVLGHYALKETRHIWKRTSSGPLCSREVPGYVYRGECGEFPTTSHSVSRLHDGGRLSKTDVAQAAKRPSVYFEASGQIPAHISPCAGLPLMPQGRK